MPSAAHVAGVGNAFISGKENIEHLAVAAGTKALLDAGITYGDVDQSIACFLDLRDRIPRRAFDVFGMEGAAVCEVDNAGGLFSAVQCVLSGQANCILAITLDREAAAGSRRAQPTAVAFVLVSTLFLTSHAYLKDSSIRIRAYIRASQYHSRLANGKTDARKARTAIGSAIRRAGLSSNDLSIVEITQGADQEHMREALQGVEAAQPREPWTSRQALGSETGYLGLCRLVYQLRGWANGAPVSSACNCLQYTTSDDGTASVLILGRSDGRPAPKWQVVKNVRDGRERLGYNPAVSAKALTQEDLEAVRAKPEFTSDADLLRLGLPIKGGDKAALARL